MVDGRALGVLLLPARRPSGGGSVLPASAFLHGVSRVRLLRLLPLMLLLVTLPRLGAARGDGEAGTPLDRFFKGQVVALKGKDLSLRYDFSTKAQLDDWKEGVPWPITKEAGQAIGWFDERLEVKGSTGARHVAEWAGDIWITCTLTLDNDKDLGAFVNPADEGDSYVSYTLNETFFHSWDNKTGGQHSILKFGKQFREAGATKDFIGFRYIVSRPPSTPIKAGDVVPFGFGIEKGKLGLDVPEFQLRGKDIGKALKQHRPGFYAVRGRMLVDNVLITGRLSDEYVAVEKLALRTEKPLADPALAGSDPAVVALVEGYKAGRTPASELVRGVGDVAQAKLARDALAGALASGPRRAVKDVIDLLYRPDVESRAYGSDIVKRLLGKDYGYVPKASEEQRSEAIRRILDDLKKNPALLDGP